MVHRLLIADHEPALSRDWRLLGTVERCAPGCLAYTGTAERAAYPLREWHYQEVALGKGQVGQTREKKKAKAAKQKTTANKAAKLKKGK